MPGTILVSVVEFMNLQLSSSTSIKVSMGKTEYQINGKGDFSFPLTSLRDDFIVKLQDSDGNEISRIGFHIKSILEKGVWEDIFALGQGHLRLKLQFILNDEERDRIRMMRQSALKKKHDELLSNSLRGAESCSTSIGNTALTFSTNDEVSDKYKETSSNKPMSLAVDVTKLKEKGLIKKPAFHSPSAKDPQRAINSEEEAILFRSSEQNDVAENNLIQSNPSSVRKMISAFERQSSLAQVMRSHIKPPPTEYQSSKIETKASSKTQYSGGDNELVGFLQERVKGASLARELQPAPVYIQESRKQINSLSHVSCKETGQLKDLNTIKILNKQRDSNARNKFKVAHEDTEEEKYNKDLMRRSTFETVKIPEKHSDRNHPSNVFHSRQDSISKPSKEEKRRGNAFKGSYELCVQMDSPHKLNSVVHFDDNYCTFESSGAWIFPYEPRKFCITTGGKNVMGLLESLVTKQISHQRSLDSSILENMEKNAAYIETGTEASKHEKIDEESKSKNSDNNGDEISGGPVKQVIKVAIIIGFGMLVLLTRQRKSR